METGVVSERTGAQSHTLSSQRPGQAVIGIAIYFPPRQVPSDQSECAAQRRTQVELGTPNAVGAGVVHPGAAAGRVIGAGRRAPEVEGCQIEMEVCREHTAPPPPLEKEKGSFIAGCHSRAANLCFAILVDGRRGPFANCAHLNVNASLRRAAGQRAHAIWVAAQRGDDDADDCRPRHLLPSPFLFRSRLQGRESWVLGASVLLNAASNIPSRAHRCARQEGAVNFAAADSQPAARTVQVQRRLQSDHRSIVLIRD